MECFFLSKGVTEKGAFSTPKKEIALFFCMHSIIIIIIIIIICTIISNAGVFSFFLAGRERVKGD